MGSKITEILISLFHLDKGDKKKNYGYFAGIISIVVNVLLFVVKLIFGIFLKSISLTADAFHSLSDVVTSFIVILGFKISAKPPDIKHPFGHGRAERIFSIVIACILIIVGIEFFINGFNRFRNPIPIESNWLIVIVLFITVLIKEFLSHVSFDLGKKINSSTLKADAWHHRTDSISTVLVIIGFILYRFGFYYIDGILGMVISVLVAYTGISIIKESGSFLMGEAPSLSLLEKIKKTALCCDSVSDVHHVHMHDYGGKIEITLHIRLNKETRLNEAHERASQVEKAVKENIRGVEVTVHIEPEKEENEKKD